VASSVLEPPKYVIKSGSCEILDELAIELAEAAGRNTPRIIRNTIANNTYFVLALLKINPIFSPISI
jgi:hypothetical protein